MSAPLTRSATRPTLPPGMMIAPIRLVPSHCGSIENWTLRYPGLSISTLCDTRRVRLRSVGDVYGLPSTITVAGVGTVSKVMVSWAPRRTVSQPAQRGTDKSAIQRRPIRIASPGRILTLYRLADGDLGQFFVPAKLTAGGVDVAAAAFANVGVDVVLSQNRLKPHD